MPVEQLKALVEEAVRAGLSYQWWILVVAAVVAAAGSYFGAYLGKKAEAKAAREDFSSLLEQVRETTKETEEIKQLLSGKAWRGQKQWEAQEKYYGALLNHLHAFRLALEELSEYFVTPGSKHIHDSQWGENFRKLQSDAWLEYRETKMLVGSAVLFLSPGTVESIDTLAREHWDLANFGSICTADYVDSAHKLVCAAYDSVVREAVQHLGLNQQ